MSAHLTVRDARPTDADAIRHIHAEAWEATYTRQVPAEHARNRLAKVRDRDWAAHTALRVQLGGGVVVLLEDNVLAGFCEFGPTEDADDDPRRVGHIMRLYIDPRMQGRGGGRLLLDTACGRMALDGYGEATLWTLDDASNRALDFYAHLGWAREDTRSSEEPPDIRYRRRL